MSEPAEDPVPAEEADELARRLDKIEAQLAEFHRRSLMEIGRAHV